ncbi:hypothetical protein Tco_0156218 [Tanacetum coccineum]
MTTAFQRTQDGDVEVDVELLSHGVPQESRRLKLISQDVTREKLESIIALLILIIIPEEAPMLKFYQIRKTEELVLFFWRFFKILIWIHLRRNVGSGDFWKTITPGVSKTGSYILFMVFMCSETFDGLSLLLVSKFSCCFSTVAAFDVHVTDFDVRVSKAMKPIWLTYMERGLVDAHVRMVHELLFFGDEQGSSSGIADDLTIRRIVRKLILPKGLVLILLRHLVNIAGLECSIAHVLLLYGLINWVSFFNTGRLVVKCPSLVNSASVKRRISDSDSVTKGHGRKETYDLLQFSNSFMTEKALLIGLDVNTTSAFHLVPLGLIFGTASIARCWTTHGFGSRIDDDIMACFSSSIIATWSLLSLRFKRWLAYF